VSLGALTLVVGAGAGGLLTLRGCAPHVEGLRCLSAQEYRTLDSVATALFPEGGAFPIGAATLDLARAFDAFLADEDDDRRADLQKALLLLEYGPVVYEGRPATFSHLPAEERAAHLERWQTSDDLTRRMVALALRRFLSVVFYDRPEVWPSIGYTMLPVPA
jgi:hypothetical protein